MKFSFPCWVSAQCFSLPNPVLITWTQQTLLEFQPCPPLESLAYDVHPSSHSRARPFLLLHDKSVDLNSDLMHAGNLRIIFLINRNCNTFRNTTLVLSQLAMSYYHFQFILAPLWLNLGIPAQWLPPRLFPEVDQNAVSSLSIQIMQHLSSQDFFMEDGILSDYMTSQQLSS